MSNKIWGIDLGTTYSGIGRGGYVSKLIPSAVDMEKGVTVPYAEYGADIYASYKTDMSTSADGVKPIEASACVLRDLVKLAEQDTRQEVKNVIISVPAYFTVPQRTAVYKAAELAGLSVVRLLNEPTAAAYAISKNVSDTLVVFDIGGGTFDVSIVSSEIPELPKHVISTTGFVIGGDDLDRALIKHVYSIQKPMLRTRTAENEAMLRNDVCRAKETQLQKGIDAVVPMGNFNMEPVVVTVEDYKAIIEDLFNSTVSRTHNLLTINHIGKRDARLVFVGGSTNCPYLREYVSKELGLDVLDVTTRPEFLVLAGVAHFARDYEDNPMAEDLVQDVTKRICYKDHMGKSVTIIEQDTTIPCIGHTTGVNPVTANYLEIELYQGTDIIASKNTYLGTLQYMYDEVTPAQTGIVEIIASVSSDGMLTVKAFEILNGEESAKEITLKMV